MSPQLNIIASNVAPEARSNAHSGEREGNGSTAFGDMLRDLRNVSGEELPKFATEKEKDSSEGDNLLQWLPVPMNLGSLVQSQSQTPAQPWLPEQTGTGVLFGHTKAPGADDLARQGASTALPAVLQAHAASPYSASSLYGVGAPAIELDGTLARYSRYETSPQLSELPAQVTRLQSAGVDGGSGLEKRSETETEEISTGAEEELSPNDSAIEGLPLTMGVAASLPSPSSSPSAEELEEGRLSSGLLSSRPLKRTSEASEQAETNPSDVLTGSWLPAPQTAENRLRPDESLQGRLGEVRRGQQPTSAARERAEPNSQQGRGVASVTAQVPQSTSSSREQGQAEVSTNEGVALPEFQGRVDSSKSQSDAPVAIEARITATDEVQLSKVAQAVAGPSTVGTDDSGDVGRKLLAKVLAEKMGRSAGEARAEGRTPSARTELSTPSVKGRTTELQEGESRGSIAANAGGLKRPSSERTPSEQATSGVDRGWRRAGSELAREMGPRSAESVSHEADANGLEFANLRGESREGAADGKLSAKLSVAEPEKGRRAELSGQTIAAGNGGSREWIDRGLAREHKAEVTTNRITSDEVKGSAEGSTNRPLQEVRLRVSAGEQSCEVQITSRNNSVEVRVRTPDSELTEQLRGKLAELADAIEKRGMQIASWTPGDTAPASLAESTQGQLDQNSREQDQQQSNKRSHLNDADGRGGHQRRQEEWEKALDQIMGLSI